MYQDSTYAPNSNYRWMGSAAMDQAGDVALGYSESSSAMKPAIAYTGHQASDGLDIMEPETVLWQGAGAQTGGLSRWGDYSAMDSDPSDGCTFWYTDQYLPADGSFNWHTRIASFAFPACTPRSDSDFSMALFPTSGTVAEPGSVSTTVSTGRTAGAAQSIALSASGLPSGVSASFSSTPVTAGGSSSMTLTVASGTAAGTYPITVTGTGTTTHTATFTLTVSGAPPADFSIGASPSSQTVTAGNGTSYMATITPTNGFSGVVGLSVSGLPAGAGSSFVPTSLTGSGSSTLTVTTSTSTPPGSYPLTITGTSGSLVHSAGVTLVVNPPPVPDFAISATPSSQSIRRGAKTTYTVTISAVNGFSGSVALTATGGPSGITRVYSPTSITGSGGSTLTITSTTTTGTGTFTLTLTGTSGSLHHSTTVTLRITKH